MTTLPNAEPLGGLSDRIGAAPPRDDEVARPPFEIAKDSGPLAVSIVVYAATGILVLALAPPLLFWITWLTGWIPLSGGSGYDGYFNWITGSALVAVVLAAATPLVPYLVRWLERVTVGRAFDRGGHWVKLIADASALKAGRAPSICRVRDFGVNASLAAEGDALLLRRGTQSLRIPREHVTLTPARACFWIRRRLRADRQCRAALVRLDWRDESGSPLAAWMSSAAGATPRADRRLTDRLHLGLQRWKHDLAPLADAVAPPARPSRVAAAAFAILLVLLVAFLPVHTHLIDTRIGPGLWRPPAWIARPGDLKPAWGIGPIGYSGGFVAMQRNEPALGYPFSLWLVNPTTGAHRPIACSMASLFAQPSGEPSHLLCWNDYMLELAKPLNLSPSFNESLYPVRLVTVATGEETHVPLPAWALSSAPLDIADDGRIFYVAPREWYERFPDPPTRTLVRAPEAGGTVHYNILDPATGEDRHLGTLVIPGPPGGAFTRPVFLPGGRHVLYFDEVIDVERGSRRAIEGLPPAQSADYVGVFGATFPWGDRLIAARWQRRVTPPVGAATKPEDRLPVTYVAIDPTTRRAETLAEFADERWLLSADGPRWLFAEESRPAAWEWETAPTVPVPRLHLFDATTGARTELGEALRVAEYRLVAGKDQLLRFTPDTGWEFLDIAPGAP